MAAQRRGIELRKKLYSYKSVSRWQKGIGAYLPEEYRKFAQGWRVKQPAPVHYIKQEGKYFLNPRSGKIQPVQNIPIPLKYPKEFDEGLWGGEAVIQGFTKKDHFSRRVPKFWFPLLKSSVVYSQVLDIYIKVTLTNRALRLIHQNYGLDHYLLKTDDCDLRSLLAIKLKREILHSLWNKTLYPNDPVKRDEVYESYKDYLNNYTPKELEWYGLTFLEAIKKCKEEILVKEPPQPLKFTFRKKLLEELNDSVEQEKLEDKSLISKIKELNPFKSGSK